MKERGRRGREGSLVVGVVVVVMTRGKGRRG
jgi:hypothetical protein